MELRGLGVACTARVQGLIRDKYYIAKGIGCPASEEAGRDQVSGPQRLSHGGRVSDILERAVFHFESEK